jgi:hypothetical protein
MQDEQLKQALTDMFSNFYAKLQELGATDGQYKDAYATVMAVALDTIGENTGPREAMSVAMVVLKRFCADKPGVNLMVHECDVTPRGKMQ